jgi:hypothetical protein
MTFKADIEKFVNSVERRAKHVVAGAATSLAADIIKKTPVDQRTGPNGETPVWYDSSSVGEARGGWRVSINAPDFSKTGSLDEDGNATIEQAARGFYQYNVKRDHSLYLSNGVDYIGILENGGYDEYIRNPIKSTESGFSYRAPQGMMKIHTNNWPRYVRTALSNSRGIRT